MVAKGAKNEPFPVVLLPDVATRIVAAEADKQSNANIAMARKIRVKKPHIIYLFISAGK